jgi:hypothetical protein
MVIVKLPRKMLAGFHVLQGDGVAKDLFCFGVGAGLITLV